MERFQSIQREHDADYSKLQVQSHDKAVHERESEEIHVAPLDFSQKVYRI